MFEFYMGTRIHYGIGSRNTIPAILKDNGWSRVGIVVDHNLTNIDLIHQLLSAIKRSCNHILVGQCTMAEPTYSFLDNIRNNFESDALHAIIGIGGGSSLDTAKAMAVLHRNRKPAVEYRGFNRMTESVLPIMAVPTTAGTGSEVTPNASFIDDQEKKKLGINGEAVRPKYAILDPELTLSCPSKPSLSAGIDSMVHAVEALVAKKSTPLAALFALEGFRHVFLSLPKVIEEPGTIENRERVMYGAFLAGIALMNSGTGPAAALSYPLGVHFGVPHGVGGGIFLPFVIQHNVRNGFFGYSRLYDVIAPDTGSLKSHSDQDKSQRFVEMMFNVWRELSVPDDLSKLGVRPDFADRFVKETLDLKGALDQNPVPFYETEIRTVLKALHV